jgi:hypothetical protein
MMHQMMTSRTFPGARQSKKTSKTEQTQFPQPPTSRQPVPPTNKQQIDPALGLWWPLQAAKKPVGSAKRIPPHTRTAPEH